MLWVVLFPNYIPRSGREADGNHNDQIIHKIIGTRGAQINFIVFYVIQEWLGVQFQSEFQIVGESGQVSVKVTGLSRSNYWQTMVEKYISTIKSDQI